MTLAIVKVLPEPVTPFRVCQPKPSLTPLARRSMAWAWCLRPVGQIDLGSDLLVASIVDDLHRVAGLGVLEGDVELGEGIGLDAVDRDDDVAADEEGGARVRTWVVPPRMPARSALPAFLAWDTRRPVSTGAGMLFCFM
jgi:hypothetical protein